MSRRLVAALLLTACHGATPPALAPRPPAPMPVARPAPVPTPTPTPVVSAPAPTGKHRADPDLLTLVVVGDVGLNKSNQTVDPRGVVADGEVVPWADLTTGIAPLIDGDLDFMNLETVVTDRNDLHPGDKGQAEPFLFRSHPDGVAAVTGLGFNLISAANNHAYDFGEDGVRETVKHLGALRDAGKLVFAGIGLDRAEASTPAALDLDGAKVAFSAIGNVTNMNNNHRAGEHKPGTMGYRHDEDWQLVTQRLADTAADLRLLSIHYGQERDIRADERQLREYRFALRDRGVDVVIGHHAHVVRGIELDGDKLIFYGLGNFLIRGARDMSAQAELRTCCDYGLLAKVYLRRADGGHFAVRAVEAFPVTDMNRAPRRLDPAESGKRIEVLNVLAEPLDDATAGARGVRFQVMADGRGLFCTDGAAGDPGAVGELCRGFSGPTKPSAEVRKRVRAAPHPANTSGGGPSADPHGKAAGKHRRGPKRHARPR